KASSSRLGGAASPDRRYDGKPVADGRGERLQHFESAAFDPDLAGQLPGGFPGRGFRQEFPGFFPRDRCFMPAGGQHLAIGRLLELFHGLERFQRLHRNDRGHAFAVPAEYDPFLAVGRAVDQLGELGARLHDGDSGRCRHDGSCTECTEYTSWLRRPCFHPGVQLLRFRPVRTPAPDTRKTPSAPPAFAGARPRIHTPKIATFGGLTERPGTSGRPKMATKKPAAKKSSKTSAK